MIFKAIINFMSSRYNLTIFQCLLYFIVGWVMGQHLTWIELGVMFAAMLCIQFITRTKAVADGMVIRQIMVDNQLSANEIVTILVCKEKKYHLNMKIANFGKKI